MVTKDKILEIAKKQGKINTADLSGQFGVSRQYLNHLIKDLVGTGKLIKIGATRYAFYVTPEYLAEHQEILPFRYTKTLKNDALEEHKILNQIDRAFPLIQKLPENVRSIFTYAFSEMLNNAIEHSQSKNVHLEMSIHDRLLSFVVEDSGIGVFRNVMQKRNLKSEFEAMQDLLKGKTTTMPKSHSGEGIFFTSKVGNLFILDSFGYQLIVNNEIPDIFIERTKKIKKGTRVMFNLNTATKLHFNDIFRKYTNMGEGGDYGFSKTEITVKLYTIGGVHISRSQARRVLAGLEKFSVILFDFDKVPIVGQAFADEIFRVFKQNYPNIKLEAENMNGGVKFMVERAKSEAER